VKRRVGWVLASFVALWLAAACLDIGSPLPGVISITTVIPPTPSVVVGQTSQDTLGVTTPLKVVAFGPNGDTVQDVIVRFFSLDTTGGLRVDSITGIATGVKLAPLATVVANVRSSKAKTTLQTTVVPLPVVPVPDSVSPDSSPTIFPFNPVTGASDSLSSALLSPPLSLTVHSADTVVANYLVSFEIVHFPGPPTTLVLVNEANQPSSVDTTNANGIASRQLRLRIGPLSQGILTGTTTDSAVVKAHVFYLGKEVPPGPLIFNLKLVNTIVPATP